MSERRLTPQPTSFHYTLPPPSIEHAPTPLPQDSPPLPLEVEEGAEEEEVEEEEVEEGEEGEDLRWHLHREFPPTRPNPEK
jgi:hypothetical protein